MKFFGKEDQQKTLQIELLEKKVAELEHAQANSNKAKQKLEAFAIKEKENAAVTVGKLEQALREERLELNSVREALDAANNLKFGAYQQIEALQNKIAEAEGKLFYDQKLSAEVHQESELLLHQLVQLQEELEKIFLEKKQLETELQTSKVDLQVVIENQQFKIDQFQSKLEQLSAINESLKSELTTNQKELALSLLEKQANEEALTKLLAKMPQELKAVNDKYQELSKSTQAAEAEHQRYKTELDQNKQTVAQLSIELKQAIESKSSLEALQANIQFNFEQSQAEFKKQFEDCNGKLKDCVQENELLYTQLIQVQEELENCYLDKIKYEKLYQDIQERWLRLERRLPNYVDFGSIEIVAFDHISDVPSITWKVKDFAQGGISYSVFLFQTVLKDGQPGIGLVTKANVTAENDSAFVPKLIKAKSKQLELFLRMGQSEFRQLVVATTILNQLETTAWHGIVGPKDFDTGFWRQSLKLLPSQIQGLPVVLRYDQVKLKRELINPDYEHLWLEFKGLGLGALLIPKFEIRLGAAMVQPGGFSQFPKFEIPLINGRHKPFESWYAESQDDHGPKLELRFSLDKKAFDSKVWAKLEVADRALLFRLIYLMPDVLMRLESEHVTIQRPWATWITFARGAVQVLEFSRSVPSQVDELPKSDSKVVQGVTVSALPDKFSEPVVMESTANKSVTDFSSKKASDTIKSDLRSIVLTKKPVAKKPVAKKPVAKSPSKK